MNDLETDEQAPDHEVVIVGGGPARCSAGVFTPATGWTRSSSIR